MLLLVASAPLAGDPAAFPLLLVATAFVGLGFGLTVPTLNTFAAAFHLDRVDRAVLVLNALLGLGTALAPVFVAVFVGLGIWWGLPVLSVVLLGALLAVSARLPLRIATSQRLDVHPFPARALLAVRRCGGPVRHLRDDERQLGPAGHDHAPRRLRDGRLDRTERVLGHGDGRPTGGRGPAAPVPLGPGLPAPAVRARLRTRAGRRAVGRQPGRRRARVRARRDRLLGAAAADHQLRAGAADHHVDGRGGCDHRGVPGRLRDRGVRHGTAAGRRHLLVHALRRHGGDRARTRCLRVRHHHATRPTTS